MSAAVVIGTIRVNVFPMYQRFSLVCGDKIWVVVKKDIKELCWVMNNDNLESP